MFLFCDFSSDFRDCCRSDHEEVSDSVADLGPGGTIAPSPSLQPQGIQKSQCSDIKCTKTY